MRNENNTREFAVNVIGYGEVTGTACEEWLGWTVRQKEDYLNVLFGRGNWNWIY